MCSFRFRFHSAASVTVCPASGPGTHTYPSHGIGRASYLPTPGEDRVDQKDKAQTTVHRWSMVPATELVVLATEEVNDMKDRGTRGGEEHNPIGSERDYSLSPHRDGLSCHGQPESVYRHPGALATS